MEQKKIFLIVLSMDGANTTASIMRMQELNAWNPWVSLWMYELSTELYNHKKQLCKMEDNQKKCLNKKMEAKDKKIAMCWGTI